jgi:hypothetical protein
MQRRVNYLKPYRSNAHVTRKERSNCAAPIQFSAKEEKVTQSIFQVYYFN